MKKVLFLLLITAVCAAAKAQKTIPAADAAKHIGEEVTICEKIYGGKFLDEAGITFLNLGGDHPKELLTLVIKGDDRKKFKGNPEEVYKDKKVCVTGKIIDYKGKPELVITDPSQIKTTE
jgi:hypothetical protein